jgi:hypothetical protein
MNTKNLVLASGAFVFAIGSAFASFLVPEDIIVKAKMNSSPGAATVCINTGFQCDPSTANICRVTVATQQGDQVATTTSASAKTYRADCTEVMGNPTLSPPQRSVPSPLPYTLVP